MFCFIINVYLCLQSRCPLVWFLMSYRILSYLVSQNDFYSKSILFCHFMAVSACLSHSFFPSVWLSTSPLQPDDLSQLVSNVWQFFLFSVAGFPLFFTLFMVHYHSSTCNCPEISSLTPFFHNFSFSLIFQFMICSLSFLLSCSSINPNFYQCTSNASSCLLRLKGGMINPLALSTSCYGERFLIRRLL